MKRYLTLIGFAVAFYCNTAIAQVDFTLNAPDTMTGNTCGALNDCALSTSEEHVYRVVIPCSGDWKFSLCNSSFNTRMYLTTGICGGTTLASNDDFCGQNSQFTTTLSGGTYFIAIEGSTSGDCGAYSLEVSDANAPVISNCQSDVTINNDLNVCGAVYNYSVPTAVDNCSLASFVGNHNSGETFPVGTTTVTYIATDNAGNADTCSFDITVVDVQVPKFSNCPNNIFVNNDLGQCGAVVTWNSPLVTDNCGVNTTTTTHSPGANFPVGVTTVTYTATDNSGNSSTCSFTVTVSDVESPTITCPGNINVNNTAGQCGAVVTGSDNCPGYTIGLTSGLGSGAFFPVGTTTEIYTITDTSGNTSSCNFTVTVVDNEAPVFVCPANMVVCGDSSSVSFSAPVVTDNCPGLIVSQVSGPTSGSTFPVGNTTITYGAIDNAGNISTCSFDVVVYNSPVADFSYSPACAGEAILFDENSTVPVDSVTSFAWDMGDGSGVIVIRNPLHQFSDTGVYNISLIVTTDQGCSDTAIKAVQVTPVPSANFTTANACLGDTVNFLDGSTIDAGNLNFMWNFGDGGVSTDQNPGHLYLNPGVYDVHMVVTSDAGCDDDAMVSVTVFNNPSGSFNSQNILCHGQNTGWINVLAGNGVAPYQFSIDSGATNQNNGIFNNLSAGAYDVLITDGNTCSAFVNINLTEPDSLVAAISSYQDIACNGGTTGSITLGIVGGASPYLYSIDGSAWQINPVFSNLSAGPYLVEVQDNNGCQDTVSINLTEPPVLAGQITHQLNVLCHGDLSGEISLAANGGVSPYQYSVNGGTSFQTDSNFLNLGAAAYNLVVKDANGCWTMWSGNITQPTALLIESNVEPIACFGEHNGSIDIMASGSVGNYQYSINGGLTYFNTHLFDTLAAGDYLVSVKDGNGCTVSEGASVAGPTGPLASTGIATNTLCFGDNSGIINLTTTGGTEIYQYSINGGNTWQLSNVFNNLPMGNHIVRTTDDKGCIDIDTIFVGQPASLPTFDLVIVQDVNCYQGNSGSITLQAGGGTPGYTYSINGGNTYQAGGSFAQLAGGTYNLRLKDSNGCVITDLAVVDEPDTALYVELTGLLQPVCEGQLTGSLNVVAMGGTAPYSYTLDGIIQSSGTFNNLASGMKTVIVKDTNNCSQTFQYYLNADNLLPNAQFEYQVAGSSVAFTNTTTDGVAYSWSFGDGGTSVAESPTHPYAEPGDYDVTLIATNGCGSDTLEVTISTLNTGIATIEEGGMLIYPNPSNGTFTIELGHFTLNSQLAIYSIEGKLLEQRILNGQTTSLVFDNFSPGAYIVELRSGTDKIHKPLLIK